MAGWYELNKSKDGKFNFVLKAANDQVILRSELYESKVSAQNGIASVQANSPKDDLFERKDPTNGRTFFNLKAGNRQVNGTSQMYSSPAARDQGIASVKVNGITPTVKDNTNI